MAILGPFWGQFVKIGAMLASKKILGMKTFFYFFIPDRFDTPYAPIAPAICLGSPNNHIPHSMFRSRSEPKLCSKLVEKSAVSDENFSKIFFCARSIQNGLKRVLSEKKIFPNFFFSLWALWGHFGGIWGPQKWGQNVKNQIFFSIGLKCSPRRFF